MPAPFALAPLSADSIARHRPFVRYCDPHVKMVSEGGRAVLDDPHSWMVAGEA